MRTVTATEKYRAVLEGSMAKREFVRQMRQQYPSMISQYDGFDSTVQILKNRQMIFEAQKPAFTGAKVYDDRPALTYSLDALERGIRAELAAAGITMPHQGVKPEDYLNAEKKAKDNLEKNPTHYLDLMSGESNKVDKHDKEKEVKRGAADKDTFNDMKKATLKENLREDAEEDAKNDEDSYDHDYPHQDEGMSEDAKKNMLGQVVGALRTNYPDITAGILKDFIKTHYQDLLDGADIEDEFREYISVNYDSLSEKKENGHDGEILSYIADTYIQNAKDGDRAFAAFRDLNIRDAVQDVIGILQDPKHPLHIDTKVEYGIVEKDKARGLFEKKGKDHDGDGDIDGDDYMAAKDKAIKKAMGKDPKEEQLKEAIKSIIKKTLINEAATVKLADWAESYESFPGVKPVVNELENIVTEIETFYDKMSDKIAAVFAKSSDFENEEGLKIGGFISPGLESAFRQDLSKVIKKGSFFKKINLPKVRTISQADIDTARSRGEVDETEVLEEPKSTVFTPNF